VAQTTEEFLGEVLSELICTEGENLDLESMLDLYLNLSEEFKDDAMKEWFDPSSRPYIILTPQAIECLVHSVGEYPPVLFHSVGRGLWTLLWQNKNHHKK